MNASSEIASSIGKTQVNGKMKKKRKSNENMEKTDTQRGMKRNSMG